MALQTSLAGASLPLSATDRLAFVPDPKKHYSPSESLEEDSEDCFDSEETPERCPGMMKEIALQMPGEIVRFMSPADKFGKTQQLGRLSLIWFKGSRKH